MGVVREGIERERLGPSALLERFVSRVGSDETLTVFAETVFAAKQVISKRCRGILCIPAMDGAGAAKLHYFRERFS